MPKTKIGDLSMVYRVEGDGEPVVLIHGLGGDHTGFDDSLKPALLGGSRVVTMDLRGHGKSSHAGPEYSAELFAEDVKGLFEAVGFASAKVVGISMGGTVAMLLAARYPALVRKLVLVDTWARCDEAARACFLEWIEASRESREVLQRIVLIRTATPAFVEATPEFVALFKKTWPTNHGQAFRKSCIACAEHDATEDLGKIKAPTLAWHT